MQRINSQSILLLCCFLLLNSCYKDQQGCLDTFATNYDLSADDPCDDNCCTYPSMRLSLRQTFGVESMRFDDSLTLDSISFFKIHSFECYLTHIRPHVTSGTYEVLDSIPFQGGIQADEHILVRNRATSFTINSVRSDMTYDSISFDIGILPTISIGDYTGVAANHIFQPENALVANDSYCSAQLTLIKADESKDTISAEICDFYQNQNLGYSTSDVIGKGENVEYSLFLDYSLLLDTVDFNQITKTDLESMLIKNITGAFSVN